MKRSMLTLTVVATMLTAGRPSAAPEKAFSHVWTHAHTGGQVAEIPAYDAITNTIWVAGVVGVDVLDAETGQAVAHIDVRPYGFVNSVAIRHGLAALAVEAVPGVAGATSRTNPGKVLFYDTTTRALSPEGGEVTVGALPDMLTFNHDGSRLLVANEGTPDAYGARVGTSVPRVYASAAGDPPGSVTVIDVERRTVIATAGFAGVPVVGSAVRTTTGMDFEPEYIAVSPDGAHAFVTLQEANAIGVLDLITNAFTRVIGLGVKDFGLPGNEIDPLNDGVLPPTFGSHNVKGLYMPDGIAAYKWRGATYLAMANEGDFREDDGDRSAAGGLGATPPLNNLRISNTDSSSGDYYAAGGRSFSIRDTDGNLVYDSGAILDKKAAELGIYDDGRSRDKGVEPEGLALHKIGGRTFAFVGLERTLKSAVAIFDVTDPTNVSYIDMVVTDGDLAPEGLILFESKGRTYLAIANETAPAGGTSNTTLYVLERAQARTN
ncbi:MAG: choice-of-anchor I family protein [Vicinamibacterales bacterium]